MRQPISIGLAAWLALALASASGVRAQPAADASARIDALDKELDEIRQRLIEAETNAGAVRELTERLAALEERLAVLTREQASVPEARRALDELDARVRALEDELRALTAQVADIEQPTGGPPAAGIRYDGGFALRTEDGDYAMTLSGYAQVRYQLEVADGDVSRSTLRLRRGRLVAAGHVSDPRLTFKVQLSAIDAPSALDYYLDYQIRPWLSVRAGQYKTQFTRSFLTSSTALAFVERPLAVDRLRYDRDVQVGVHGEVADGRVGYYVGVSNGAGPNALNDNIDLAASARVDVAAVGSLSKLSEGDLRRSEKLAVRVGAGVVYDLVPMPLEISGIPINRDVDGDGAIDNAAVFSASADVAARYRGLEAVVEGVLRSEDFGTILDHVDNQALLDAVGVRDAYRYVSVYGQLTYLLPHRVLVGARVGHTRLPFLGLGGRGSSIPDAERALEIDALVQLYRDRGRLLGVMYSLHDLNALEGAAPDPDMTHRLIVETQLRF